MTEIKFLAQKRRSIRKYQSSPIPIEEITEILETALVAPSGKNTRSPRFVLVDDPEMLESLSQAKDGSGEFVRHAPLAIVVCTDKSVASRPYIDAAIAASYIQLTVAELELGSCWDQIQGTQSPDGGLAEERVKQLLELPEDYGVLCILAIGTPANPSDLAPKERVVEWERVFVGKYEARKSQTESNLIDQ